MTKHNKKRYARKGGNGHKKKKKEGGGKEMMEVTKKDGWKGREKRSASRQPRKNSNTCTRQTFRQTDTDSSHAANHIYPVIHQS